MSGLDTLLQKYEGELQTASDWGTLEQLQKALETMPQDHPERPFQLQTLGNRYQSRYHSKGAQADLELALQYLEEALQTMPNDSQERASHLAKVGSAFLDRYDRARAETDLERAIRMFEDALEMTLKMTPWDHPERAARYRDLGQVYSTRYHRMEDIADLELAIMQYEAAVESTSKPYRGRALQLENVARGYHDLYRRTGWVDELKVAIERWEEAFDLTPTEDPERAGRFQSLGIAYLDRYHEQWTQTDLELAIDHLEEALKATPIDNPKQASRLRSLGLGYFDRYQSTGSQIDRELVIQQYEEALNHSPSPPLERLERIDDLLSLHLHSKHWQLAYQAASTAMSIFALITPLSLENSDKQHLLAQFYGLGTFAAAIALDAKASPYEAIRLLEIGRGVIINDLYRMRSDLSDLQQKHPQVAEEYINLRDQLHTPARRVDLDNPAALTSQVSQRHDAAQKLERKIQIIRGLPDFDRFLMAPSEDEFKVAGTEGPIIIINVTIHRCDALIINKHELRSIPLPDLSNCDIESRKEAMARPELVDTQLLEWLWDTIAKPVLDALGFSKKPDSRPPRVWWIPTGPLARFPIHAAGYHYRGSDTVLDRVISSYSSSVRALMQGRQKRATLSMKRGTAKAVLVGMEKTPGLMDLPFVPLEMNKLDRLCSSMQLQVCKPQPCREDVLTALNDCDIFHFAGHGETGSKDPSRSSLILRDGPLAVADIFETNFHNRKPFLAYLSACGTGQVKNEGLIDEALHLIAAYQTAGFRHVVGTLWGVNDKTCVEAAATTYKWVQEQNMTDESVSEGLHHAIMKLRQSWTLDNISRAANRMAALQDKDVPIATGQARSCPPTVRNPRNAELCEDAPLYWVPYVHFGI